MVWLPLATTRPRASSAADASSYRVLAFEDSYKIRAMLDDANVRYAHFEQRWTSENAVEALEAEAENAVRRCAERRRTGGGRTARGAATSAGYDESHHAVGDVGGGASRDDDEDEDVEDPRILLRRQRETMDEQDDALDELSIVASRTRDVSLAVNDELDLHAKLLDGVEDEVEDTRERLTAATRAVRQMMRRGSNCRSACIATAVIALCFLILLLIIKLQS